MAVGPWGHGRTSPPQGGSLLGKGSVEIGDLIVSCGHKVLVDGYWLEDARLKALARPGVGVFGRQDVVVHACRQGLGAFSFPHSVGLLPPKSKWRVVKHTPS